jgi:alpha/beta superfamily hydrolase
MKATALTVHYRGMDDPDERGKHLLARSLPPHDILILAGSSMGGYVSLVASEQLKPQGLFLMASALGKAGYQVENPVPHAAHLSEVQGWGDTVTLPQQAIEFARNHGAELLMVDDEHRLSDSLPAIQAQFERLVRRTSGARLSKLERPKAASPSRMARAIGEH